MRAPGTSRIASAVARASWTRLWPNRLFIDSACLGRETMIVSGGRRGLSVELSPRDLVDLTDAEVTDLAQV